MRDPADRDDEFFDELGLGHEPETEADGGFFEPEVAARLSALTIDVDAHVRRCGAEIDAALAQAAQAGRDQDLVGWLAAELRREYLSGYLEGLSRLAAALGHLAEGTPLADVDLPTDAAAKERDRRHAVDRIARINDALLRRQEAKNRRGVEN